MPNVDFTQFDHVHERAEAAEEPRQRNLLGLILSLNGNNQPDLNLYT